MFFFVIACDLSSADELLLTEMLFNGLFNDMDASQTAAVLSCFVCDERSNEMPKMSGELSGPLVRNMPVKKRTDSLIFLVKSHSYFLGKLFSMMEVTYQKSPSKTNM